LVQEDILFHGHPNIRSRHGTTIEITKESSLTLRGDCIIGVSSNKACNSLDPAIRRALAQDNTSILMEIIISDISFVIKGQGSNLLTFLDRRDIVIRRSAFCCPRTLAILSDKASSDLPRSMVELLRKPETQGLLRITAG
jgi:hypothetical protein